MSTIPSTTPSPTHDRLRTLNRTNYILRCAFFYALGLQFIGLKLTGLILWPWGMVTAPIWGLWLFNWLTRRAFALLTSASTNNAELLAKELAAAKE